MSTLSLTPSHIIQHLYCPRFTYFERLLRIPQYEERHYKVQRGREVHLQKARQNVEYLRRRIGAVAKHLNQYLTNGTLRGEVDEVLLLNDDTMAPLDYKFARYEDKVYSTYRTQLYCYAWLIESRFGRPVKRGYLVYTRSQNKLVEVPIARDHIAQVQRVVEDISTLLARHHFPRATKVKKRCVGCTYRNICVQ
ncbi:MAG: CRISPR-associated protein Cas4 [Bacteroidota bacterium]